MWKPGSPMPPAAAGTKRPRPASEPKKPSAGTRSLSGATKNMRFMQRGGVKRRSEGQQQKSKNARNGATTEPVAASSDFAEKDVAAGRQQEQEEPSAAAATRPPKTPQQSMEGDAQSSDEEMHDSDDLPIAVAASSTASAPILPATPLDMYGWEQSQALGRRSFGGFQPVTAENWYHQQQEHKVATSTSRSKQSDRELLRRHAEISNSGGKKDRKQQQGRKQKQISGGPRGSAERRNKLLDDFLME